MDALHVTATCRHPQCKAERGILMAHTTEKGRLLLFLDCGHTRNLRMGSLPPRVLELARFLVKQGQATS